METLRVELGDNSYNIYFNDNFDALINALDDINAPKKMLIVTDNFVKKLYSCEVKLLLENNGYDCEIFSFDAGEENKNIDTVLSICEACIRHNMDRKSMILALGGGVVGDIAGFAASIFMRGIDFIQVPTTLLSQSDSSVGGKTGVDFMMGKNILGAFHQPKLVYINVSTLKTLPEREVISGMGEVIKHGIIRDKEFFDYLYQNFEKVNKLECDTLIKMANTNCSIKSDVVSRDEFENGLRADLNFGHTIGHAIESYYDFALSHGECVGLGMIAASYIAKEKNLISCNDFLKIEKILSLYGFKTRIEIHDKHKLTELIKNDKKKNNDKIKFILPTGIGSVIQTYDVGNDEINLALDYISNF